ncbi:hypothetical protein Droror1_Dr00005203 [Drosera rotundifolia]
MIVNWFLFNVYCEDCIDVLVLLSIFCERMKWICSKKAKHEVTMWLLDPCSYSGIHFCRLVVRNRFDLCSDVGVDVFSCVCEILLLVVDLICFMSFAVCIWSMNRMHPFFQLILWLSSSKNSNQYACLLIVAG